MDYNEVLSSLCALPGPSGFEGPVVQRAAEYMKRVLPEVSIDSMGNLLGVLRCGKKGAKKLLLDAHLDEIGFIVACLPPPIQTRENMNRSQPIRELYLDVGLSQEEAERRIPIGTPAVYRTGCVPMGDELLCGKALDDRACFAVLLDALERLDREQLDVDLYVLGSTQEETHSTGAITAAYGIVPDLCVAVDVTHGDSPDASKEKTFPLGEGPVIGVGPNCTAWMAERIKRLAKELDVSYQMEVMSGSSGTNGWPLQVSREGVATAVLSLPLRYMHTPVETVSKEDLTHTAQLLAAFLQGVGGEVPSYA